MVVKVKIWPMWLLHKIFTFVKYSYFIGLFVKNEFSTTLFVKFSPTWIFLWVQILQLSGKCQRCINFECANQFFTKKVHFCQYTKWVFFIKTVVKYILHSYFTKNTINKLTPLNFFHEKIYFVQNTKVRFFFIKTAVIYCINIL